MKFFLLNIFLLFFLAMRVHAEVELISVEGLNFKCNACRKVNGNFCEVPWQGKTLTVLCDSLFEVLLERAYEEKAQDYPKNEELLNLIASDGQSSEIVNSAFNILLNRKLDSRFFYSALKLIIAKHYPVLESLIEKKSFNSEQNLILWQERSKLKAKEAFLLAKNIPEKGINDFIKDLSVVDLKNDLSLIQQLQNSNVLTLEEGNQLNALSSYIINCSEKYNCENTFQQNSELAKYANRLQNAVITKAVLDRKLKDPLLYLSKIEYLDHRTPETHEAVLLSLQNSIAQKSFDKTWKKLSIKEKDFISFMAKNDSRIAELVYGNSTSNLYIWLISAIATIASTVVYFYYKKSQFDLVSDNIALKMDIEEYNDVMSFFSLPKGANLKDLKKRYREMARELHPDTENGDSEEFLQLNYYYKKAMYLLAR